MGNNDLIIGIGVGLVASIFIIHLINNRQTSTYVTDNLQVQPQNINEDIYNNHAHDNNHVHDNTIYKNNEKWEIERGEDGTIKSLNIIRDVKVNK